MKYPVLVSLLFLSLPTFANGHEAGNGGDVVTCRDKQGNLHSIELLDFYEARTFRNIQYDTERRPPQLIL